MIKVVCIDNSRTISWDSDMGLTINKLYDAKLIEWGDFYTIRNDEGNLMVYSTKRFILLADWREKQIKSIIDG